MDVDPGEPGGGESRDGVKMLARVSTHDDVCGDIAFAFQERLGAMQKRHVLRSIRTAVQRQPEMVRAARGRRADA
jgi:hypothetical protein